jgi:tetratricopeptide (TPR) repeat protein
MDQPLPVTTPKAAQPVKRRTVYEALSGFPFGQSEMRRQLRTLGPGGAHNEGLVSALLDQRIQQDGREATLGNLLAQAREGRAGRIEYAQIFALLENTPEGEREELGPILQELLDNLDTKDTNQLRRLARLAAKTGQGNLAAMLWQWCSTGRGAGYVDQALLNEVVEALDGEERDRVVTAILAGSRPPDNYYWQRDAYDVAVLRTWTQILGPSGALAKVRPIIDEIHDSTSYPRRAAASLAAELLARAGEIEAALDCLEIAVCKLDPPTDLQHAWLRSSWTTAAGIGDHDLRRLFPKDTEGWADAGAWFEGVADRLSTWLAADRVHRSTVFRALAVLTVRLHESGREALARKQLDQVDDLAGESADALLWRIDIRRRLGLTEEADLFERRLLTQRRLHPERVPEVLQRILTTEGPKAALDLADTALSLGRHPDLLELLAQAADLSEDPSLAAFWRTTAAAEAAADTALRMREIETATDG